MASEGGEVQCTDRNAYQEIMGQGKENWSKEEEGRAEEGIYNLI